MPCSIHRICRLAAIVFLGTAGPLFAQSNTGELHLKVFDPKGLALKAATVQLVSEVNDYYNTRRTDDNGGLIAKRLPFGVYRIHVQASDFAEASSSIEIRSAVPVRYSISLSLAPVTTSIDVRDAGTLIDPHRADASNEIGTETITTRTTSLPGRSLQDLVNSEPGWLYEGNAVLHPRGAEYQTQFVVPGFRSGD